jgi:hypothetical protein
MTQLETNMCEAVRFKGQLLRTQNNSLVYAFMVLWAVNIGVISLFFQDIYRSTSWQNAYRVFWNV